MVSSCELKSNNFHRLPMVITQFFQKEDKLKFNLILGHIYLEKKIKKFSMLMIRRWEINRNIVCFVSKLTEKSRKSKIIFDIEMAKRWN